MTHSEISHNHFFVKLIIIFKNRDSSEVDVSPSLSSSLTTPRTRNAMEVEGNPLMAKSFTPLAPVKTESLVNTKIIEAHQLNIMISKLKALE